MGKLENKSITVPPSAEQEAIDKYQLFGWVLMSSQEVFNKNTRNETRKNMMGDDELWNVTETVNYVKLLFQRDMEIENYKKIKELEEKYFEHFFEARNIPSLMPGKFLSIIIGFFVLIGLLNIFAGNIGPAIPLILIGAVIFGIRFFIVYKPKLNKSTAALKVCQEIEKEVTELI